MKPMLAATIDHIDQLTGKYPLLGSPKLDGIRALIVDGKLYSRNMKLIPNRFVHKALPLRAMNGWDGELIVGKPEAADCFRATTSGVMSVEGEPNFCFYAFDMVPMYGGNIQFLDRFMGLKRNVTALNNKYVKLVPQVDLTGPFAVHDYEEKMLARGFEGVMLRSREGTYKHGRSTMKEGALMKLKQFADSEAVVLGVVEQMENTNEQTRDALGRSKRSSHKAGKVGKDTLGALRVKDVVTGVEFDIGTGFDDIMRKQLWDAHQADFNANLRKSQWSIIGCSIKYKYFPTGSKDKPRFPVFIGFRKD